MIELIAVRHGQSTANVAFPAADAVGSEESGIPGSDADVGLTPLGREQSAAVGRWLADRADPLDAVVSSPYTRARDTTWLALATAGLRHPVRIDERLRDRELGVLEMLTAAAVKRRHPEEAERRTRMDEFLYRPPGGESMPDVALRLRSFLADATPRYRGGRVLVVGHDATVLMLRYVIEELSQNEWYAAGPVRNASVTRWVAGPTGLELVEFNTPLAP